MENEIEVGEYVRTKNGKIDIYLNSSDFYNKDASIIVCKKSKYWFEDIRKHSSNIIDLIEEDDIIRIIDDYDDEIIIHIDSKNLHDRVKRRLESETWKLKSIVTKEQFKNIEYFF